MIGIQHLNRPPSQMEQLDYVTGKDMVKSLRYTGPLFKQMTDDKPTYKIDTKMGPGQLIDDSPEIETPSLFEFYTMMNHIKKLEDEK